MTDQTVSSYSAILPRAGLRTAIAAVLPAVERNTLPILSAAMLREHDGHAVIETTNLDMTIRARVPDAVMDDGFAVALPAHLLQSIERKAPDGDLEIDTVITETDTYKVNSDGEKLIDFGVSSILSFGKLRVKMDGYHANDWPEAQIDGNINADFSMPTDALLQALTAVAFAISTEETRYYLNGVYVHYVAPHGVDRYHGKPGKLRFVATDGHRMGVHEIDAPCDLSTMPSVIIPRDTVNFLIKMAKSKGAPETVRVVVNTCKCMVTLGTVDVIAKLIDGTYPDYMRVLPTDNQNVLQIDRTAMIEAIQAVTAVSNKKGRAVKMTVDSDATVFTVNDPGAGSADMEVSSELVGDCVEVGFISKYVLDILDELACDTVRIEIDDYRSPVVFVDEANKSTRYVLMPYKV